MNTEYKILKINELTHFIIRDIRQSAVDDLVERFKNGYNPSKPLTVVSKDNELLVANGNHRLKALKQLGIEEAPCIVYEDADPYRLAVEGNEDEDTYSPMDLFDWIEVISVMRDEGYTQEQIGERIGWTRGKVSQHFMLLEKIATQIIGISKSIQKGRVASSATNVANFTEGWFRNSGLYDLTEEYQERLINDFIGDKCNWNNNKVKSESAKYKRWIDFINVTKDRLVNQEDLEEMVKLIESNSFRSEDQVLNKIKDFNSKAENKLICGDSIAEMENLEDGSIDLIITDPPYGIDYSSNYSKYNDYVTKGKISNDEDLEQALKLTDDALEVLSRKTKENAHIYLFTSWKTYHKFEEIVSKYFNVKNMIVWDKGNASMGDLEGSWGNQHELVIFATKGNRKLNTRKFDVLSINRVPTTKAIHPTQKPEELIKIFLEASAHVKDTVIDPFMGSGSTIRAIKEFGGLNYIGIELDKERFNKASIHIGSDN